MGILNVTPDSFSDGGEAMGVDAALDKGRALWRAGADILDIGAESTRPGALPVGEEEELRRLLPVLEAVADRIPIPISVDTSKAGVMRAAWGLGAGFFNDITALRGDPLALPTAAELGVPVCLMHMRGRPRDMQQLTHYEDVLTEVRDFLAERIDACVRGGIARERIVIDPGFGFAKDLADNLILLRHLDALGELGLPILAGLSRKAMIGAITGTGGGRDRVMGSVAAALWALGKGAAILRVHDVAETVQAVRMWGALAHGK
ncbi:dihydropteroate synthase [Acidithiobacillus sulfuriphilus]|uniref:dihydropteroate synthase n=1 Tax=Acidithiobacillus sulfuriphilus TaxID=1867749 RepID=UPI003F632C60